MHASRADLPAVRASAIDELPTLWEGFAKLVGAGLGVTAFGVNIMDLPPDYATRSHDESESGQQELYVALRGAGAVVIGGGGARAGRGAPRGRGRGCRAPAQVRPRGVARAVHRRVPGGVYERPEWSSKGE